MNMEIKVQHVGRIDSMLHDLSRFEINSKSEITMEVALDVIDCYRRGGKLERVSVHKILKASYWLLKRMENVRKIDLEEDGGGGEGIEEGEEERSKVVVCGDLHGQFFDLLYVLDLNGAPSEKTRYLFNGRRGGERGRWGEDASGK